MADDWLYGKLKRGAEIGGAGGKIMDSACSGESRARRRRLGSGRMGLSGYIGEVVSGECLRGDERDHS